MEFLKELKAFTCGIKLVNVYNECAPKKVITKSLENRATVYLCFFTQVPKVVTVKF